MNKIHQKNKPVSLNQDQQVVDDYNSGIKRNTIINKYKITDSQLVTLLRNAIHQEEKKQEKIIHAHPKHSCRYTRPVHKENRMQTQRFF